MRGLRALALILALTALVNSTRAKPLSDDLACPPAPNVRAVLDERQLYVDGQSPAVVALAVPPGRPILLAARESGVDVVLEAQGSSADNPVRRTGTEFLMALPSDGSIIVRLSAKTRGQSGGRVRLTAYDAAPMLEDRSCRSVVESIALADAAYAKGQAISAGLATDAKATAASLYRTAALAYTRAFEAAPRESALLRARLAHALSALLYQDVHDWPGSERWANLGTGLYEEVHDSYGQLRTRALRASAQMEIATSPESGDPAEAVRYDSRRRLAAARSTLRDLARLHRDRGETYDQALQLNNLGLAYSYQGAFDAAIADYRSAARLYAILRERDRQAQVLQNIAVVDSELGRSEAAIEGFHRALGLLAVDDSAKLYCEILNNSALANLSVGNLDQAFQQFSAALDILMRTQQRREEARSLYGIGEVYAMAGDRARAADFLSQSLEIRDRGSDARGYVESLRALASIADQDGDATQALARNEEALKLAIEPPVRLRILLRMADAHSLLSEPAEAAKSLEAAADIARSSDSIGRAAVDLEATLLESRAHRYREARRHGLRALAVFRHFGLLSRVFATDVALANVELPFDRDSAALRYLDHAIRLAEPIRLQAANPELRAGLLGMLRPAFDLEIDLLSRQAGEARERGDERLESALATRALTVAESYRARVLQDISATRFAVTGDRLDAMVRTKSALLHDIAGHRFQLEKAKENGEVSGPRVVLLSKELSGLLQKMSVLDSEISRSGKADPVTQLPQRDWDQLIPDLPRDTAVLSFWFTPNRLYAWLVQRAHLEFIDLGDAAPIRTAAEELHTKQASLQTESEDARLRASGALGHALIDPVGRLIAPGVKRLIVVADGPLHYIPFAALRSESLRARFLVGAFDIGYSPNVRTLLSPDQRSPSTSRMLLVDDAVYSRADARIARSQVDASDDRVDPAMLVRASQGSRTLDRLPATADEASIIARNLPASSVDRLEGFEANRLAVLSRPLETYGYIHFAVHGTTDAEIPQLSSLILSSFNSAGEPIDDKLWAGDLLTRRFSARTVVLSACDTALGRQLAGEGIMGLRYIILARGARSVVASLWAVPDRITADLMGNFYTQLLRYEKSPEGALSEAMRAEVAKGVTDPGLWGSFTATSSNLRN